MRSGHPILESSHGGAVGGQRFVDACERVGTGISENGELEEKQLEEMKATIDMTGEARFDPDSGRLRQYVSGKRRMRSHVGIQMPSGLGGSKRRVPEVPLFCIERNSSPLISVQSSRP